MEWYHFQYPSLTVDQDFKVVTLFDIQCLKNDSRQNYSYCRTSIRTHIPSIHLFVTFSMTLRVALTVFKVTVYLKSNIQKVECCDFYCIISRRLKISLKFLLHLVVPSPLFFDTMCQHQVPRGTPLLSAQNTRGAEIVGFTTDIAVYVRNGKNWARSFYKKVNRR